MRPGVLATLHIAMSILELVAPKQFFLRIRGHLICCRFKCRPMSKHCERIYLEEGDLTQWRYTRRVRVNLLAMNAGVGNSHYIAREQRSMLSSHAKEVGDIAFKDFIFAFVHFIAFG